MISLGAAIAFAGCIATADLPDMLPDGEYVFETGSIPTWLTLRRDTWCLILDVRSPRTVCIIAEMEAA